MKNKLHSKILSVLIVLSMLVTGFVLPVTASDSAAISAIDHVENQNELYTDFEVSPADNDVLIKSSEMTSAEDKLILKYIGEDHFDSAKHSARLVAHEDLNTFVFQNTNGTRTIYMMEDDVKYIDSKGEVKVKDLTLVRSNAGYGIGQSNINLLIPDKLASGVTVDYDSYSVQLIPQNVARATVAEKVDDSVVYNGVFGNKINLRYTPTLSGLKEDIILSEYVSDTSYTFILRTNGLTLGNQNGKYVLTDGNCKDPVYYLDDIIVYDAIGKPDVGKMDVVTVEENQEYLLTVSANDDFLSDPDTVYPVTIDPSITISDNDESGSIIDAPVFEGYPAKNFGNYAYNRVGKASGNYGVGRTVVKLSGLTSSNVYQTITANQITNVSFYAKEATGGAAQFINLYPLVSNTTWTETSITWNNVGTYSTAVNYGNTMSSNKFTAFDITGLVKAWKTGTYSADAGFIMMNEDEVNNNKSFTSSEAATPTNRPYVVMTYEPIFCGGDSFEDAEVIAINTYHTVNIDTQYKLKYFEFVPTATDMYSLVSSSNNCDTKAWIYNSSEQQLDFDDDLAGNHNFCLTYHLISGTTYYFAVGCYEEDTGIYDFCIRNADMYSNVNYPSITLGTARNVPITAPYKTLCYKITPSETKEYLFFSSNKAGDPQIWIYNSSFEYIDDNDDDAGNLNFRMAITLNAGSTYYLILRHHHTNVGTFRFNSFYDANIPYGSYYLKNIGSSRYMDIEGPGTQEWIQQWIRHTELQEKWRICKGADGYYIMRSEYDSKKYVGISNTSTGEDNIKLFANVSNNTRWKIYANAANSLILVPKNASQAVLYAPDNAVGTQLQLNAVYDVTSSNRSLWMVDSYSLTLNTFYDNAFNVRYGNGAALVNGFSSEIIRILRGAIGLEVTMNSPIMITSTPEYCKFQRGLDLTYTTINTKSYAICPSNTSEGGSCIYYAWNKGQYSDCENCTSWYQAYRDFIRDYPGNSTTTSVLFTGNKLYDDTGKECNRSFRWYNNGIILQEIWKSSSSYAYNQLSCILHEISHSIGAPDHYHDVITDDSGHEVCKNSALCITCTPSTGRPKWCIMGDDGCWRKDLGTCDMDEVYCEKCRNEIIEHLISHHFD